MEKSGSVNEVDRLQRKYYDLFMKGHGLQTELRHLPQDLTSARYRAVARELIEVYAALGDWHYANDLLGHIVADILKQPDFMLTWPEGIQLATMAVVNRLEGKVPAWQEETRPILEAMLSRPDAEAEGGPELRALLRVEALVKEIRADHLTPETLAKLKVLEREYPKRFSKLGFLPMALIVWEVREHYHFRAGNYDAALDCLPWIEKLAEGTDFEFLHLHACQMAMGIAVRREDYRRAVEEHERYVSLREKLAQAQDYAYSECLISVYGIEQKQRLMEKLRTENRRLEEASQTDPLTRLYNRQYLTKFLARYQTEAARPAKKLAAVMMDIDFFKGYNDHYGHIQGDTILSEAGRLLWEQRMGGWTPVRYGGEEFLLLRETTAKEALEVAETVRRDLEAQRIPHHFSKAAAVVTVSAGVSAKICIDREDVETLIHEADQALYEAKARGRNQCVRYRPNLEVTP